MYICRISSSVIASAILILSGTSAKAEWDHWAVDYSGDSSIGNRIYTCISQTGVCTQRTTKVFTDNSWTPANSYVDDENNLVIYDSADVLHSYNLTTDTWTNLGTSWTGDYQKTWGRQAIVQKDDGTVDIGIGTSSINLSEEGIKTGGENLIKRTTNGELHIGENSWITKEEGGVQKVYAKDAAGNPIPIDYTNGTKLLINGRDVEQAINNVGALSAALTGLPTVPEDSPFSCGVGSGTHGGNIALAGGCASRINERLTLNTAASIIPNDQEYQGGNHDRWSGRLGFVFKIGKINKPAMLSVKEKKELQAKVHSLDSTNNELRELVAMQNEQLEIQNERLEKLETIALAQIDKKFPSFNLSSLFLNMRSFLISMK